MTHQHDRKESFPSVGLACGYTASVLKDTSKQAQIGQARERRRQGPAKQGHILTNTPQTHNIAACNSRAKKSL